MIRRHFLNPFSNPISNPFLLSFSCTFDMKGSLSYFSKPLPTFPYGSDKKGEIENLRGMTIRQDGNLLRVEGGTGSGKKGIVLRVKEDIERVKWMEALQQHVEYSNYLASI